MTRDPGSEQVKAWSFEPVLGPGEQYTAPGGPVFEGELERMETVFALPEEETFKIHVRTDGWA